ncbi:major facilitator superfamily MFS_1 [Syntrophobotulus glycolicus DSM 8271]|uniref:Major facilitator superfamily MFS_1 n=1 Tax=Syntrophobotulus glycolicus (strain DSM 8271 / FlGlyR) TaxID=645991 RepID=F0SVW3_SYNGF|nr:MFS transporter [Syntrophobotulus glycolicus]ADY55669.1 major facilitator superfamily MFS_1 [Syntrophobotulus glycolicus DSM 8271]
MLKHKNRLLVLGIIFIACNLRTSLTSVGPLINDIRTDLGISNSLAGFLTTLPLLIFAGLSPLSSKIGNKIGEERTIFFGFIVLIIGILLRSFGGITALFAGTVLIGAGIVTGNVLIPSMIKRKFPQKIGLLTSIFSTAMSLMAGIASGVSVPLAMKLGLGWRNSLLIWGLLVVIAIFFWIPQLKNGEKPDPAIKAATDGSDAKSVWRSPLAWKIALFMGLQSLLFYSLIAWLPDILSSRGLSMETGGWLLSVFQIVAIPTSFIAPIVADRREDQRGIAVASGLVYFAGMLGFLLSENMASLTGSVILMAIGGGACVSLAFTFIGLRSASNKQAAELSGMAQSVGYLLAAAGPLFIGVLSDYSKEWTSSIVFLLVVILLLLYFGFCSGQNKHINEEKTASS